jgi:hypothetical protein
MRRIERVRQWSAGAWIKSSRSYGGGACVEVRPVDGGIAVRDSKHPGGPQLSFTKAEWAAFMTGVQAGEFDDLC